MAGGLNSGCFWLKSEFITSHKSGLVLEELILTDERIFASRAFFLFLHLPSKVITTVVSCIFFVWDFLPVLFPVVWSVLPVILFLKWYRFFVCSLVLLFSCEVADYMKVVDY